MPVHSRRTPVVSATTGTEITFAVDEFPVDFSHLWPETYSPAHRVNLALTNEYNAEGERPVVDRSFHESFWFTPQQALEAARNLHDAALASMARPMTERRR